ncbi:metal-dependent hydrolase [Halalkalibacterium halodurans]|jgi:inner membrane protein|uniref:metal-dependent hydrolase n=1 Tax=Halalkalibacterium halodurans TaxID=86665 RepID=UPI0010683685|nr:metal-dependent hydrolase [Halalkalibacterium halodurans]MDY7221427.1 metal-dependent hydrolase [Halalkalibacterium halodurans]MDY7240666.1 metal-dependent hydrolase [Halalkalibacterium halodurans]MED3648366.1 metal-dependent hydrolase [Halalkalibacterium halodurans]MED4082954.1 metal-dependent hydrolase [Halalkalibacterium halodurans]MED4086785.1 metal-dependent hydrolase [Halalkalibacterium halodurans]
MDTGTHVVMGVALGGLAAIDPAVTNDPMMKSTVMIATIIGSQAPDFDTILKLRNNAVYIRNHRGLTHSLPALFIWPFLVAGGIWLLFPESAFFTLWLWSFIAVFLHVFVDIFNAYGTQALRPISDRWIALGVINIFDPFIFFAHVVAIFCWYLGTNPIPTFLLLYFVLTCYYVWRLKLKHEIVLKARNHYPEATHVFVSPTLHWNKWHVVIRTKEMLYVARVKDRSFTFYEQYPFEPIPDIPVLNAARNDKNLAAFLSFSPTYRWEINELEEDVTEVRFYDLRYRSKGHYPFVACVQLDQDLNVIRSYTGWVFSEKTLQKKLEIVTE